MRRLFLAALCAATLLAAPARAGEWLRPFCGIPQQCKLSEPTQVALTPQLEALLNTINGEVNRRYRGVNLPGWDYPKNGVSNCVGYSLTKRRELIAHGVPEAAIRLATVRTLWGDLHLVVVVRTDHGDYVLDNAVSRYKVVLWTKTAYRFQAWSPDKGGKWDRLVDTHTMPEWTRNN